jgi:hypothetical protein
MLETVALAALLAVGSAAPVHAQNAVVVSFSAGPGAVLREGIRGFLDLGAGVELLAGERWSVGPGGARLQLATEHGPGGERVRDGAWLGALWLRHYLGPGPASTWLGAGAGLMRPDDGGTRAALGGLLGHDFGRNRWALRIEGRALHAFEAAWASVSLGLRFRPVR